ncbi:MAG: thiosulfate oxidation carrier complex protein SoxZ [Burkholderiales bacterium]
MKDTRRNLLQAALSVGLLPLGLRLAQAQSAAPNTPWNKAAFEAKTVDAALKALGLPRAAESKEVVITADELSENGAKVPVTLSWTAVGVRRLILLVDKNPAPLSAVVECSDGLEPRLSWPVKIAQSGDLLALAVLADGRVISARREVRVTLGGCAVDDGSAAAKPNPAPEATRIRAQASGGGAVVRALLAHEMESGQRKDASGKTLAAWHITEVQASHNGRTVWSAQWGGSVSRNPLVQFTLKAATAGDRVGLSWVDNRGAKRSDDAAVT